MVTLFRNRNKLLLGKMKDKRLFMDWNHMILTKQEKKRIHHVL